MKREQLLKLKKECSNHTYCINCKQKKLCGEYMNFIDEWTLENWPINLTIKMMKIIENKLPNKG